MWNRRFRAGALVLGLAAPAALAGCASGRLAAPPGQAVPDPAAFELRLRQTTLPSNPQQANFAWTLDERGSRVRGRGVVRYEAPERIRLDLFGPRGETYVMAALVGDEYRLPTEAAAAVALPSPSLLWAALGVLEPPPGSVLASATSAPDGSAELRYQVGQDEVFAFTFQQIEGAEYRLARIERAGRRGVIETVHVDRDAEGSIVRTRYRDWSEFRDLTLEVESIRDMGSFPPNIWRPDAVPS
jgi:hypothetical protein